jgi:N-acetylglucosaminyldiphosphoundecaprenol N-acetyl-beta-D-mannosaminyltransferase
VKSENILGTRVNPLTIKEAVTQIKIWVTQKSTYFVSIASINNILSALKESSLVAVQNSADMTTADGMPLVWILRLRGHKHIERVCGPDLMPAVLEMAEQEGFSNYFYGCTDEVLETMRNNLKKMFPGLKVAGSYAPPFRKLNEEENREVIDRINRCNPQLVWVGLSTPKQELWMYENRGRLKDCVIIGVGAAFDYFAGNIKRAPKWMQSFGLEWLFRLVQEPRRLWKRYLLLYPRFPFLLMKEFLGKKTA